MNKQEISHFLDQAQPNDLIEVIKQSSHRIENAEETMAKQRSTEAVNAIEKLLQFISDLPVPKTKKAKTNLVCSVRPAFKYYFPNKQPYHGDSQSIKALFLYIMELAKELNINVFED